MLFLNSKYELDDRIKRKGEDVGFEPTFRAMICTLYLHIGALALPIKQIFPYFKEGVTR